MEQRETHSPRLESYLLALIQLNATPNIKKNLEQAKAYIQNAADQGAQLIGLPECTPFLGPDRLLLDKVGEIEDKFFPMMRALSRELSVAIFAGGYRQADENKGNARNENDKNDKEKQKKAYNCLFYVDVPRRHEFVYDKVHLFDVNIPDGVSYEESRYIQAGSRPCSLLKNTPFGNLGFSICYDLRFPEMYRRLSASGGDTLLIPSAFTAYTGSAHWHTLLRARAIENLSYVFAPAQTGLHFGKRKSYGHSLVISPWGEILGELGDKPGILSVNIQSEPIFEARRRLPSLDVQSNSS